MELLPRDSSPASQCIVARHTGRFWPLDKRAGGKLQYDFTISWTSRERSQLHRTHPLSGFVCSPAHSGHRILLFREPHSDQVFPPGGIYDNGILNYLAKKATLAQLMSTPKLEGLR
jgi:hypothetical protein